MKGVVMAGGEGTRLRPLTEGRPKPMVPILSKPIMEYIVKHLKKYGVTEIVSTLCFMPEAIKEYFRDGSELGVKMNYAIETSPLGTAGSVKNAEKYLDETFVIISGDALVDFDLSKIFEFHRKNKALVTIVLKRVTDPTEFGIVMTDRDDRIVRFLEKPGWGEVFSDRANTGIYVLEPEVLSYIPKDTKYDFSQDLFPKLLREGKPLYGYTAEGYWCDVGNLEQYIQAHVDLLSGKVNLPIPGHQIREGVWVGVDVQIDSEENITPPVYIGKGCRIKAGARLGEFATLGQNIEVDSGVTIERSIIMSNSYIGENSTIQSAIICANNVIEKDVQINEGVVIGDNCSVGNSVTIAPEVKIWPGKVIEDGANVTENVVWGTTFKKSLFSAGGVEGTFNVRMTPLFASKLGMAYGTTIGKGKKVTVSRDPSPASRLIKRAITAGIVATGVDAYDLTVVPTAVSRYSAGLMTTAGGLHVSVSDENPEVVRIEFFDKDGITLGRDAQRKIEAHFYRGAFPKISVAECGIMRYSPRLVELYSNEFMEKVDRELIKKHRYIVMLDTAHGSASLFFPNVLAEIGCEVIAHRSNVQEKVPTKAEDDAALRKLSLMTKDNADIGIMFGFNAEKMFILDEKGNLLDDNVILGLLTRAMLKKVKTGPLIVPVNAPSFVDRIAEAEGTTVQRTKLDEYSLMKAIHRECSMRGEGWFAFSRFHQKFDPMFSAVQIIELMARENKPLSVLVAELPRVASFSLAVRCGWDQKGEIMRKISEETQARGVHTELIDGVKIFEEKGWVLIVPDSAHALMRIYVEADTPEERDRLAEKYKIKLENLVNELGNTCSSRQLSKNEQPENEAGVKKTGKSARAGGGGEQKKGTSRK